MLADNKVMATIAVKDAARAKQFYQETLGLKLSHEFEGGMTFESGGVPLFVYPSKFAGTNQATSASWIVDDVAPIVDDLKAKGVTFEHYDFEWATLEGDIHVMKGDRGEGKAVWFKDPDGNILAVSSGDM
jgi:catechol-2,3-dioxygenase